MKRLLNRRTLYVLLVIAALGVGALAWWRTRDIEPPVEVTDVRKGEFVEYLQIRGEIKALKSMTLNAPSASGDLQIVKLVKNGTPVKAGDVVVQFDPTQLQRTLEEKRSELKRSEAEINRTRALGRMDEEQKLTENMNAEYNVQRARLDVTKQEILSDIEAEKTKLTLANNEQRLEESRQKLDSGKRVTEADLASRRQRREKALFEVRQAESRIAALTLKAPVEGTVNILPNFRARGFFGPGSVPEFKEGDRAWSGAAIAELPELNSIRVTARVDETDRGQLKSGLAASVRVDAVPDKEFPARLVEISPLAKLDFSGWPITKNFDIAVQLDQNDARLRPGMSANARVAVNRVPDSILVPAAAVFQKDNRSVVYVWRGRAFEERAVEVGRRGKNEVMILRGLAPGERVAVKDPTQAEGKKS